MAAAGPPSPRQSACRRRRDQLRRELLNAFLGCVLVYSALFGVGQILLRSAMIGIGLLVVSALAAFAIARNLNVEAGDDL